MGVDVNSHHTGFGPRIGQNCPLWAGDQRVSPPVFYAHGIAASDYVDAAVHRSALAHCANPFRRFGPLVAWAEDHVHALRGQCLEVRRKVEIKANSNAEAYAVMLDDDGL